MWVNPTHGQWEKLLAKSSQSFFLSPRWAVNTEDSDSKHGVLRAPLPPWLSGKSIFKRTRMCPVCGASLMRRSKTPAPRYCCWSTPASTEPPRGTAVFAWPASLPTTGAPKTLAFQGSLMSCFEKEHGSAPLGSCSLAELHKEAECPPIPNLLLALQSTPAHPDHTVPGPSVHCFLQEGSLSSRSPLWSIEKLVSGPGALPTL